MSGLFHLAAPHLLPAKEKTVRFEHVARTHVGCRRKVNEDALLARPEGGVWAVADGMGGHEAGEVASALLVDLLGDAPAEPALTWRVDAARASIQQANRQLVALAKQSDRPRTIGSTIVALVTDGRAFACLWAGDSRAYRVRQGALEQLSHDHSLVQQLVDAGDLDEAAAANHPNANIITRAVGAAPQLALDSVEGEIVAGDVFLLASDGLTRLLSDDEILRGLAAKDSESLADQWIETCLARQAPDNVTFIIIKALAG